MSSHERFLELCAAATSGELNLEEQARLNTHLAKCPECRRVMGEYEAVTRACIAGLAEHFAQKDETADNSWSVETAEKAFVKRLDENQEALGSGRIGYGCSDIPSLGKRSTYRPAQIPRQEFWMSIAATVLLAVALGSAAHRMGLKRGADEAGTVPQTAKPTKRYLEDRASAAGYERAQFEGTLAENVKVIRGLQLELSEQSKVVAALKLAQVDAAQQGLRGAHDAGAERDEEPTAAQAKLIALQEARESAIAQLDESAAQVAALGAKVDELTQRMRDRDEALDRAEAEVAKGQELLERDRDIRELMGARDLYMADVHDVSRSGTDRTYGRVFYTNGKSLIFYAFDLDGHPGIRATSSFQAWGRRGPDKQQALSLGIFYEDNVSKKRWVLKTSDPKTLEDIDAVFVTVEPSGGSPQPSGKQLLFAYLRVNPNHP